MDDKKKLKRELQKELHEMRKRLSDMEHLLAEQKNREEALSRSMVRYRNLVENTSDWIWETDTKHRCVYTNNQVKNILGYEPEEILGKPPTDFMTQTEADFVLPFLNGLLSEPQVINGLESRHTHKDGTVRYLEINIVPFYSETGSLSGFRGITRDVTDRKKMEHALQAEEERFRLVSQAANDAIYDWDIATGRLWLSESHRALLDFPENGDHLKWWRSHLHPEDRERILSNVRHMLNGIGSVWMDEYRFLCANGQYINVIDRGQILRNEKGIPVRIVGSMMDVTNRKLAEEALAAGEEHYRLLIEDSPIAMIVYGPDGTVMMANKPALNLLNTTENLISGKPANYPEWTFLKEDGSPLAPDEHPISQGIAMHRPVRNKIYGIVRPGSKETQWFLISTQPQRSKSGQILRIVSSFIDISENIRMHKAIAESEAKFRFLTEKMSDVIWTMDMNLIFTYISPSIKRALDYSPDELLGHHLSDIITPESNILAANLLESELALDHQGSIAPARSVMFDAAFYHRNHDTVWYENIVSFIRNNDGNVIGIYGVSRNITEQRLAAEEREKLIKDLKQALADVKTLSGLLPICSHCKKIRDDKGYWNQLETYLTKHSDALFSHGICPDCAAKLYPDFLPDKKKN